jgi:hypothetical protein
MLFISVSLLLGKVAEVHIPAALKLDVSYTSFLPAKCIRGDICHFRQKSLRTDTQFYSLLPSCQLR